MCVNSSYPNFGQSKMQTEDLTVFPSVTCNMSSYNLSSVTQSPFREHLSRSFAPLWIIPCPFPRTFCFWKSGYCVRFLIKRPQSFLIEFQVFVSSSHLVREMSLLNNYHAQYSRNNLQLCTWFLHDMFLTDMCSFFSTKIRTEIKTVPSIWYISNVQGCTRTDWLAKMAQLWFNLSSVWSRQILICKTQCVTKFHKSANDRERWSRKSDCVTLSKLSDNMLPRTVKVLSLHFVPSMQSAFCT